MSDKHLVPINRKKDSFLPYDFDSFSPLIRCTKRGVVAMMWKDKELISYGVNHGLNEKCECIAGVRTPNCTHAEDMIFDVLDLDIYKGCVLEINWFPCSRCAENVIKSKVKAVCWTEGKHFEAIEKLEGAGIECFYGTYEQYLVMESLNATSNNQSEKF